MYILCGLIYLKIVPSRFQRQRGPKFIPFKLTKGGRNSNLVIGTDLILVIGTVLNLAWIYSWLQIMGKYSGRCPYIFFTLIMKIFFCLGSSKNGVSKWDLCVLCLLCVLNI